MEIEVRTAETLAQLVSASAFRDADFIAIHGNCTADFGAAEALPQNLAVHGATSCLGAMSDAGVTDGLAAFILRDPAGAYGSATADISEGAFAAGQTATRTALARCDRVGEKPDLIWIAATPGAEEDVLAGIEAVVGPDVPIIGGSAADNSVAGDWFVFDQHGQLGEGLVVSVLFPSGKISFAYQNGYAPTASTGRVTAAEGRHVTEIDGRPAMTVYADWTGGAIPGPEK